MIDPIQSGHREMQAAEPSESAGHTREARSLDEPGAAAFRALLDRLAQSARDLESASSSIEDPRELGRVVEDAGASVQDAVLLGTDLLEAYRAAQARAASEPST